MDTFLRDYATGATTPLATGDAPLDPRLSPDDARLAYVRGGELHVLDLATHRERALTSGAPAGVSRGLAEFVAQEEMDRDRGFWWSPDARLRSPIRWHAAGDGGARRRPCHRPDEGAPRRERRGLGEPREAAPALARRRAGVLLDDRAEPGSRTSPRNRKASSGSGRG